MTGTGRAAGPTPPAARPTLWHNADFVRLWIGQTVSRMGSEVSLVALPFTAVVVLGVDAFQAGLLGTFEFLPFLLIGLPAGAIIDRLRCRQVLIAADLGRCLALGSIPLAAVGGHLTLLQLYVVALVNGVLTVFFDVAYQSYLPALVEGEALVEGNSKLELSSSAAMLTGPGLGGALVSLMGAPRAIAVDAVSYLWSVALLLLIRRPEPEPVPLPAGRSRPRLRADIAEGLRYVLGHPLLRPIAFCTATSNLFGHVGFAIFVLFAVRDLGMSAVAVGIVFSVGALGTLVAAAVCSRITARLGIGRATLLGIAVGAPAGFLVPIATGTTAIPLLITSMMVMTFASTLYNINQVSLRQGITPRRLLGRLNATVRFVVWGTIPIGAFIGGVLGSTIGLRATLMVSAAGQALSALWIVFSPVVAVRHIEDQLHPERRAELGLPDPMAPTLPLVG